MPVFTGKICCKNVKGERERHTDINTHSYTKEKIDINTHSKREMDINTHSHERAININKQRHTQIHRNRERERRMLTSVPRSGKINFNAKYSEKNQTSI